MITEDQDKLCCDSIWRKKPLRFSFYLFSDFFPSFYFLWQKMVLLLRKSRWWIICSEKDRCDDLEVFFFTTGRSAVKQSVYFVNVENTQVMLHWHNITEWHFIVILYVSMNEWNEFKLFDMLTFNLARLCRHNKSLFANLPPRTAAARLMFCYLNKTGTAPVPWSSDSQRPGRDLVLVQVQVLATGPKKCYLTRTDHPSTPPTPTPPAYQRAQWRLDD